MTSQNPYRAAGTFSGPAYTERFADRELRRAVEQNQRYPNMLAPRQSGKSSLLYHLRAELDPKVFRFGFVDISTFRSTELRNYDRFLTRFFADIADTLRVPEITVTGKPKKDLLALVAKVPEPRVVLLLDEIDTLRRSRFKDTFFSNVRNFFNDRADPNQKELKRVQFVLAGAARVEELIRDSTRSPFNVGELIQLNDFTLEEVTNLCRHLATSRSPAYPPGLPERLQKHAGGSVYLTLRSSFAKYQEQFRDSRQELLSEGREGGTSYPASVAKTWSITREQLSPLARLLLRIAAWFALDAIPRSVFSANHEVLAEALGEKITVSDLAIEKALGELDRFSLIRLTGETVSVHRLLQAVEQDSLGEEERKQFLLWGAGLLNAFAPESPVDVRTWRVWLPLLPHAETLLEHTKRNGVDSPPIAVLANRLGVLLHARAAYAQAEPLMRRALEIDEKSYGAEHPTVARDLNNLAVLLQDTNRLEEAEPLVRRALGIGEKVLGAEHPDVASSLNNLTLLLKDTNRLEEAEPLMRRALGIDEKSYGLEHPNTTTSFNNLALLLQDTNRLAEAEPLYRRALPIFAEFGHRTGHEHPHFRVVIDNYIVLLEAMGLSEDEILARLHSAMGF